MRHCKKQGFTLLELSIVLVMISLITASILAGQSIHRSYQLRSVAAEFETYTRLIHQFRDEYQGLPGDITNATSFWGAEADCPNTTYTAAPHTTTCNGDGNGKIGEATGSAITAPHEWYRAWQHLGNANLLGRQYNGISGTGSAYHSLIGINIPASKWPGTGYELYYQNVPYPGNVNNWPQTGHILVLGKERPASTSQGFSFIPVDVMDIDVKIDDGLPGKGRVIVGKPGGSMPHCATSDDAEVSVYNTEYKEIACWILYTMD